MDFWHLLSLYLFIYLFKRLKWNYFFGLISRIPIFVKRCKTSGTLDSESNIIKLLEHFTKLNVCYSGWWWGWEGGESWVSSMTPCSYTFSLFFPFAFFSVFVFSFSLSVLGIRGRQGRKGCEEEGNNKQQGQWQQQQNEIRNNNKNKEHHNT